MPSTIGNPLSWGAKNVNAAGHGLAEAVRQTGGDHSKADPELRPIGLNDIGAALKAGVRDFLHFRSDVMAACLLYPIIGLGLIGASAHRGALPLIFPILSGFALVGPIAAIGLYELSRRRERGEPAAWSDMMRVTSAPGFGGIVMLSAGLACWYFLVDHIGVVLACADHGPVELRRYRELSEGGSCDAGRVGDDGRRHPAWLSVRHCRPCGKCSVLPASG